MIRQNQPLAGALGQNWSRRASAAVFQLIKVVKPNIEQLHHLVERRPSLPDELGLRHAHGLGIHNPQSKPSPVCAEMPHLPRGTLQSLQRALQVAIVSAARRQIFRIGVAAETLTGLMRLA